jgi:phosphoribosyl-ATP pyrophosphohydrolase
VIELEHSLVSLSKWESEWQIPFLATEQKTREQTVSYIRFMFLGDEDPEVIIPKFSEENYEAIDAYINKTMTATTFPNTKLDPARETVTAELIYYWMIALGIPFSCENWHLSRLLTLVRVCNVKNSKSEKVDRRQSAADRRALNEERRRQLNTKG